MGRKQQLRVVQMSESDQDTYFLNKPVFTVECHGLAELMYTSQHNMYNYI